MMSNRNSGVFSIHDRGHHAPLHLPKEPHRTDRLAFYRHHVSTRTYAVTLDQVPDRSRERNSHTREEAVSDAVAGCLRMGAVTQTQEDGLSRRQCRRASRFVRLVNGIFGPCVHAQILARIDLNVYGSIVDFLSAVEYVESKRRSVTSNHVFTAGRRNSFQNSTISHRFTARYDTITCLD